MTYPFATNKYKNRNLRDQQLTMIGQNMFGITGDLCGRV